MNCWIGLKIILMSNYFKPLVFANVNMSQSPVSKCLQSLIERIGGVLQGRVI